MKIYKFRPLGDCTSLARVEEILETGKFWCSRFWDLNDPMEGIYRVTSSMASEAIDKLYDAKARRLVCSFSERPALCNILMWSHYANGFKGVAIEVEIPEADITTIEYCPELPSPSLLDPPETVAEKILRTKLKPWRYEHEVRFVLASRVNLHRIGDLTGIYICDRYRYAINHVDVTRDAEMREYNQRVARVKEIAKRKGLSIHRVFTQGTRVKSEQWHRPATATP